jgi:hypothetical protein
MEHRAIICRVVLSTDLRCLYELPRPSPPHPPSPVSQGLTIRSGPPVQTRGRGGQAQRFDVDIRKDQHRTRVRIGGTTVSQHTACIQRPLTSGLRHYNQLKLKTNQKYIFPIKLRECHFQGVVDVCRFSICC